MAAITFPLHDGFKVGDVTHHEVALRELSPLDLIEASAESEKAVATPDGYQFLVSPTDMAINVLLRQIDSIGDFRGPFTRPMLSRFSRRDFELLQAKAEELDHAVLETVLRGRADAPGAGAGAADSTIQPGGAPPA